MTQQPKIDPTEAQKGKIYLWLAILIFGAASAVVAKLIMIGEKRAARRTEPDSVLQPAIRRKRRRWGYAIGNLPQRLATLRTQKS